MTAQNPVCHLPPPNVATTHDPVDLPAIPPAGNTIASLQATVNAMRQVLMIYTGQMGQQGRQGRQGKDAPSGSWKQKSIQTEVVRIYNPNDKTQYVDVRRVNQLTMVNNSTKQTWTFQRPPDSSGT